MSRTQKHPTLTPTPRRHPTPKQGVVHARDDRPPHRRHRAKTQPLPYNLQLLFPPRQAQQLRRDSPQLRDSRIVDLRVRRSRRQRDGIAIQASDVDLATNAGEDLGREAGGVGGEDGVAVAVAVGGGVPARGTHDERVAGERGDGDGERGGGEEGGEDRGRPGAGGEDEAGAGEVGLRACRDGEDADARELAAQVGGDGEDARGVVQVHAAGAAGG